MQCNAARSRNIASRTQQTASVSSPPSITSKRLIRKSWRKRKQKNLSIHRSKRREASTGRASADEIKRRPRERFYIRIFDRRSIRRMDDRMLSGRDREMNPEIEDHTCKCKLEDGSIVEYDLAVSYNYYTEHKSVIDAEYFNNSRKIFLGWGAIYSVDEARQSSGYKCAFFNWVKKPVLFLRRKK
jgi:hypothetical protein